MTIARFASAMCLLGFGLASSAYGLTYGEATDIASKLPRGDLNASNHGKLCEVLGVQVLQELNPGATIYNGIVYKKKNRVVGELDLVMVKDEVVTDIIEVKCMVNFNAAAKKADEQNERMSEYLGRCDVDFSLEKAKIPCEIFGNPNVRFGKMSYTDAKRAGFDYDLNFTRSEILKLIKDVKSSTKKTSN